MSGEIELTVGIPSFNGARFLALAIDSILGQTLRLGDAAQIEILVFDNASTDTTGDICRRYRASHPQLFSFVRHAENLGFDANLNALIEGSRGRFVKVLGDDDVLAPGSLQHHLDMARQHPQAGVFLSDIKIYDSEFKQLIQMLSIGDGTDVLYVRPEEFLDKCAARYGQVSSLMFRRDCWLANPLDGGLGSGLLHTFKMLHMLQQAPSVIMPGHWVGVRAGSPRVSTSVIGTVKILFHGYVLLRDFAVRHPQTVYQRLAREQQAYAVSVIEGLRQRYQFSPELEHAYEMLKESR